ncbi:hypothetical protein SAMD00019534_071260 [Acytostelium subglobosum LB1]|uniref:hypothetical protein n=1 Tax=Acytostelium subglobosum LB1 TaxID=1410327 RepID=UPI000644EE6A|nr:hypothetical protein SAMD00019534_071260 [Acytostelium subglobosum LB1]GAM23951.1 hypothetical protein SAMD00019534_071260 [Acytostelium subglobosum LB1]|eukprot:XP_012752987.1 hypothetical protein SAMD00019534_071260 [Acytostelium subglobosum LB1]
MIEIRDSTLTDEVNHLNQKDIQERQDKVLATSGWRDCMTFLYDLSTSYGYIQEERLLLNIILPKYTKHNYQPMQFEVTINCSKPEIIAGVTPQTSNYLNFEGQCVICFENVGSAKRKGLRAFEFECNGRQFFRQFPPYPYFNFHNIIIDKQHIPQVLTLDTIKELLEMCERMPGYKVASNSDREGTGVTNMSHRHYQAGDHPYAVFEARVKKTYDLLGCQVMWLHHPCCCLKVVGSDRAQMELAVNSVFKAWRTGDFPALQQPLQTCSFICTLNPVTSNFEFILFARNAQQPRFLTRATLQCIKKEFVGIFELCGYGILPGRLKEQLKQIEKVLESHEQQPNFQQQYDDSLLLPTDLQMFHDWIKEFYVQVRRDNPTMSTKNVLEETLQTTFIAILKDNSPVDEDDEATIDLWMSQCH